MGSRGRRYSSFVGWVLYVSNVDYTLSKLRRLRWTTCKWFRVFIEQGVEIVLIQPRKVKAKIVRVVEEIATIELERDGGFRDFIETQDELETVEVLQVIDIVDVLSI